jgi:hypothetical protein
MASERLESGYICDRHLQVLVLPQPEACSDPAVISGTRAATFDVIDEQ